jgi:hypothetical protein
MTAEQVMISEGERLYALKCSLSMMQIISPFSLQRKVLSLHSISF